MRLGTHSAALHCFSVGAQRWACIAGVVKALFEEELLPRVLSGASAGSTIGCTAGLSNE